MVCLETRLLFAPTSWLDPDSLGNFNSCPSFSREDGCPRVVTGLLLSIFVHSDVITSKSKLTNSILKDYRFNGTSSIGNSPVLNRGSDWILTVLVLLELSYRGGLWSDGRGRSTTVSLDGERELLLFAGIRQFVDNIDHNSILLVAFGIRFQIVANLS